jgi:hypothetical protein
MDKFRDCEGGCRPKGGEGLDCVLGSLVCPWVYEQSLDGRLTRTAFGKRWQMGMRLYREMGGSYAIQARSEGSAFVPIFWIASVASCFWASPANTPLLVPTRKSHSESGRHHNRGQVRGAATAKRRRPPIPRRGPALTF